MIESTGMSGRLPVLSFQVKEAQSVRTDHLEDVTGRRRCVGVEATHRRITNGSGRGGRIERDIKDRAVRQDSIAAGHVDPGGLVRASSQTVPDLHVAVVGTNDHGRLQGLLEGKLIDEGAVAQCLLGQVRRAVYVPGGRCSGASDRLPNPDGAGDQMAAASGGAGRSAVVAGVFGSPLKIS